MRNLIEESPLLAFSLYIKTQSDSLKRIGNEIISITNNAKDPDDGVISGNDIMKGYDLFYLWVLGAYEITRTMWEYRATFNDETQERITLQKRYIAKLRVPFAKHQISGNKNKVVYEELSMIGFDGGLEFKIEEVTYNSTDVIKAFIAFINTFSLDDFRQKAVVTEGEGQSWSLSFVDR